MVCIVVTRGGAGDVWRHPSLQAATDHPITQLGDAVLESVEDVLRTFTVSEMGHVAARLGDPQLQKAINAWQGAVSVVDREHYAERIWAAMRRIAVQAPSDDTEIVRVIRSDRRAVRSVGGSTYRLHPEERNAPQPRERSSLRQTRELKMSDETEKKGAMRTAKYSDESVINYGIDKDGKPYGEDNNPKKVGSKSHERFTNYRNGETVKDLLARGGSSRADVNYDAEKGYITLS